jgi:hypothetical protein
MTDSQRRFWVLLCVLLSVAVVALTPARTASAHEHVTVDEYELTVGWRIEPAFVGVLNGLDLGIEHHLLNGSTEWVLDADITLNATLRLGTAFVAKGLEPQFGNPGWYTFDVIPTREGDYSVRILGTLDTTPVDVTIDLDRVRPASGAEFPPTSDPTPGALQGLRTQAATATALGIAGLALGLIAVAWTAWARRGGRGSP